MSAWRLYFPELERQGFEHYSVPVVFFYYSAQPNYTVDITSVAEQKAKASAAHVSQFGDMVTNYDDTNLTERKARLAETLRASRLVQRDGDKVIEKFRRSTGYGG